MAILGISVTDKGFGKFIYTICEDSSIKLYCQAEENFKFSKSINIDTNIRKVVSKSSSTDSKLPCFMIHSKTTAAYPCLLTLE